MTNPEVKAKTVRILLHINGIVQGVGFRPFVFRLARDLNLSGIIKNTSTGVHLELQGEIDHLENFLYRIKNDPPPLAEISEIKESQINNQPYETNFTIEKSEQYSSAHTLISPDMATCPDCFSELFSITDRRYLYPFINCTNCGPRYTIIESLPYDRPGTTMSEFKMCQNCLEEYNNPADRRFHAQPNACPVCGPRIWLESNSAGRNSARKNNVLERATELLLDGYIIAIKGLGGFHLAVDATNYEAVQRLRAQKNREEKPLAIMLPDINRLQKIVTINRKELYFLNSPQCPILLLEKKATGIIADNVAPGNKRLGVMLPYTPLHHILLHLLGARTDFPALVMTSANISEEPIVIENDEARNRLENIANFLLFHNRDILIRNDDSVLQIISGKASFIRRSRGYAPRPIYLKSNGDSVLAVGGQLKNTICLTRQNQAFLSQHIGDLENLQAYRNFEQSIEHMQQVLDIDPEIIAYDLHPGYFSTAWALKQKSIPVFGIQHHHAHMASCIAEWHLEDPVIAIILDGTGYGYDNNIWGGEVFVGNLTELHRFAAIEYMPLPGGDKSIREPWRIALAYLYKEFGEQFPSLPFLEDKPFEPVLEMVQKQFNTPMTSSCGRLFDAVSALCNVRTKIHYEAQAAIELMQLSGLSENIPFNYEICDNKIMIGPLIRDIVTQIQSGITVTEIGSRFHSTLVHMFAEVVEKASKETRIHNIVLSGGAFQNEILLSGMMLYFSQQNFNVFCQKQVPANDGGLSLGQAEIARALSKHGMHAVEYKSE